MDTKVKQRQIRTRHSRISSKNQVTLPVSVMQRARLAAGADVIITADGPGQLRIQAVEDDLDRYLGALPGVWPDGALEELRNEWR